MALIFDAVSWRRGLALLRHGVLRVRRCVEVEVSIEEGSCCGIPVHDVVFTT